MDAELQLRVGAARLVGGGDDTVGNPHRAHISQFEFFELCVYITETLQTLIYRAIRANGISSNSILPPLASASSRKRPACSRPWLRTNGVSTNGAAAKVMNFDKVGKKGYTLALLGR